MREQREQFERESRRQAQELVQEAQERAVLLKSEGLRQVGELQVQVEQLLGMRAGLTQALQRLGEDLAAAMARIASSPATAIDRPIEHHVERWSRTSATSVAQRKHEPVEPEHVAPAVGHAHACGRVDGCRDEHLAAARERAHSRRPRSSALVRARECRRRARARSRERLPRHVELRRPLVGRRAALQLRRARARRASQSTGRRLSGSTSERSSSSSPW